MSPCTLLKEILRLVPCNTEIILDDECNVKLYHDVNYGSDLAKYGNCIVIHLGVWDDTTLYVRIINENC